MSKRKIAESASVISFATALSRIFGYVRDMVVAFFFGTGLNAQAFVVAFKIPNLLRQLVGEGAVTSALVPVFSEYMSIRTEKELKNLVSALFYIFSLVLVILILAGIISTPVIVKLIAPGFLSDEIKYSLTVKLTRLLFPYLFLVGLGSLCMGLLHSFRIFAPSAFGPVFLNISIITSAFYFRNKFSEPVMSLAWGVLIGGLVQFIMQFLPLMKKGIGLKFVWASARKGVYRIGKLLLPRAVGTAVYQVNVFVDTILASFAGIVGEGAVAALYFSNRIIQLPFAIFAVSLATAALPTMSTQSANGEKKELRETVSFSLESVFLVMLPSMAGLFVLAKPITSLLFEWGAFGGYSTDITSTALFFYTFGLFAYGGVTILVNAFYAVQDTVTPVKIAARALFINVVFNLLLMWKLKIGGLALATSISSIFNFVALFVVLNKKIGRLNLEEMAVTVIKIIFSAVIMGIFCQLFFKHMNFYCLSAVTVRIIIKVFLTIFGSVCVFAACAYGLKVEQMRSLIKWILRKK